MTCMEINWCTANGQLSVQGSTKPQVLEGISYKRPGPFKIPVKTVCWLEQKEKMGFCYQFRK